MTTTPPEPARSGSPARLELLTRRRSHAAQRRARPAAAGAALGQGREGVSLRDRRGRGVPRRPVPRPLAAPDLPLHVRAGVQRRLPRLLGDRRRLRRLRDPPGQPRRDALGGVARSAREAAGLQAADGLDASPGRPRSGPTSTTTSTSRSRRSRSVRASSSTTSASRPCGRRRRTCAGRSTRGLRRRAQTGRPTRASARA